MGFITDTIGDIVGDITGSNAATDAAIHAADTQASAADRNTALLREIYNQNRTDQMPFLQAGYGALNPLMTLLGLPQISSSQLNGLAGAGNGGTGPVSKPAIPTNSMTATQLLQQDPSYQWRLDQGQKALQRSAAARGGLLSGGFAKDLTDYAQGAASQEYGNVYNRLAALTGFGQTQANNLGTQASNYGQQAANSNLDAANARATGYLAAGNRQANNFNQMLQLGTTAAAFFSDRRLKSDVVRVGTHPSGLPVYEYTIFGRRERGVMADEARELRPNAVSEGPGGYLMVDYSQL